MSGTVTRRRFVEIGAAGMAGVLSAACATGPAKGHSRNTPYRAGVARATITPTESVWMAGYAFRDRPSEGKFQDLFAKALALEDAQGNRVALLTVDLIGLPAKMCEPIASEVAKQTGLPRSAIMFAASHTHSGPTIGRYSKMDDGHWEVAQKYHAWLESKLVRVLCDAVDNLQPAHLYRGCGKARFGVNRRQYNLGGVSIGVNPIGPVDPDVPVLKITDTRGELQAVVLGYACHNTTLSFYKFCGDYAGYAQAHVEAQNPGTTAMFFSGCGADINPNPRRTMELVQAHGEALGQAVQSVLSGEMEEVSGGIRHSNTVIDLPLVPAPTRAQLSNQSLSSNKEERNRARTFLEQLNRDGSIPEAYPYPIQVWTFGENFDWIAMAGEVVVDYALRLKHELGRERTWVTAYANDYFTYVPSLRVLREGGYEGYRAIVSSGFHGPWAPSLEERIVEAVHTLVKRNHS